MLTQAESHTGSQLAGRPSHSCHSGKGRGNASLCSGYQATPVSAGAAKMLIVFHEELMWRTCLHTMSGLPWVLRALRCLPHDRPKPFSLRAGRHRRTHLVVHVDDDGVSLGEVEDWYRPLVVDSNDGPVHHLVGILSSPCYVEVESNGGRGCSTC